MTNRYNEPVSRLLRLGPADWQEWDDYSEFGFRQEHIPELIRLGSDYYLLCEDGPSDDEVWAPMHAWRALTQMFAVEAIVPLTRVLDWSFESGMDLISEGLRGALITFGEPTLEPLSDFLAEPEHTISGYSLAAGIISSIGEQNPEHRDQAIKIITSALDAHFKRNDGDINGFWIADLMDLKATGSYPVIKKVFETGEVNLRIAGDLEDVELEFGMREKRDTPPPNTPLTPALIHSLRNESNKSLLDPHQAKVERTARQVKKEKSKRKAEKKSRKKNRKR